MIIHNVIQNTPQWYALRLGKPTASEFSNVVTASTGALSRSKDGKGPSKTARKYAMRLAAERLLQETMDDLGHIDAIRNGREMEPDAAAQFEFASQTKTQKVGFVTTDDGRIGASPDRLILDGEGLLEIKCPGPTNQLAYMVDGFETDYWVQVQGQLWVCERDYSIRYAYHPKLPPAEERTNRDEKFIRALRDSIEQFADEVDEIVEKAKSLGAIQVAPHVITPAEAAYGDLDDKFDRIRSDHWGNPSLDSIDERNTYMAG